MVRRCLHILAGVMFVTGFFVFTGPSAYAYIDPGSGSFIVQILIGAFFGAGLAIATFWRRLRAFFGRLFSRKAQ